jgi:hypothetical protein
MMMIRQRSLFEVVVLIPFFKKLGKCKKDGVSFASQDHIKAVRAVLGGREILPHQSLPSSRKIFVATPLHIRTS